MEKLIYYAATSPEKLDRIGEYLNQRIERYLYRSRFGFVKIGMEAMDQLLKACPSQWLNLYIEYYLKTVQRLLESPEPEMQTRYGRDQLLEFLLWLMFRSRKIFGYRYATHPYPESRIRKSGF